MGSDSRPRGGRTAAELMAELESDPAFVERMRLEEEERLRLVESYARAVEGLLSDLAANGCDVDSLDALRKGGRSYPLAVPVLVRWLNDTQSDVLKPSIIAALTFPWAAEAAPALLRAFANEGEPDGVRWAIGNALYEVASDRIADELLALAADRRFGRAREMVVVALGKLADPRAVDVLRRLLADEDVVGHAVMAIGQLRAGAARAEVVPLLRHPKAWIRKEAKKALGRMDRG